MHCSQHIENDSIGDAFAIDLSQVRSIWAFPPFALARPFIAFLQQHESSLPDIIMCLPHWSIVQAAIACIRGSSITGIVTQALAPPRYDRSFPVPHDLIMVTIRGTSAKTRLRVAPYVAPNDLWRGNVIVLADELHDAHCLQDYTDTDVLARVAENTMANRHVSIFRTRNSCTALIIRIKNGVVDYGPTFPRDPFGTLPYTINDCVTSQPNPSQLYGCCTSQSPPFGQNAPPSFHR